MIKQNLVPLVLLYILSTAVLAAPVSGGLTITDGAKIISPYGATSPVITVADTDIPSGGTITIDVQNLYLFVNRGTFTDANVEITSDAANATWTGVVSGEGGFDQIITLTSTGGNTTVGENIIVTFTGAGGNPWLPGSIDIYGVDMSMPLTVTRTDTSETGTIDFMIETPTPPPGGLSITDGVKITTPDGATSPVITIADTDIPAGGTITINVPDLYLFTDSGAFTDLNVEVSTDADAATWSGVVSGEGGVDQIITLTSTGGNTTVGESVNVTFTGAHGNPWLTDSFTPFGDVEMPLTVIRTDTFQRADPPLNFRINTTPLSPPVDLSLVANFSASPTSGVAPQIVTFTDTSLGNPTEWTWDFGDSSGTSTEQNPTHSYTKAGSYTVTLTVSNASGISLVSKPNYINLLNGSAGEANTEISGLIITNCGGPQTVTVNTSILTAALNPGNSVLEIQSPAGSGFKNITFYALNGIGFSRNGSLITGNPTGVHLVSEEIAPSSGFSNTIGTLSAFNYSFDLSSYPCNAVLTTKIWEGVISEYDNKFRRIADGNNASVVSTAYTAQIIKTNFPSGATAKLHMSVNSSWNSLLRGGPGIVFIWRIADDGNSGQILPTTYLYKDPVNNLDYFEADSPLGLSTFGISSLTGNNNPFQVISFIAASIINPPNSPGAVAGGGSGGGTAVVRQTTIAPEINKATPPDPGKTAKIYSNAQGVITQATMLQSSDGLATANIGTGIVANDIEGKPLSSITIKAIPAENLPGTSPGASFSFAGRAYELQPDGATFSPGISISFIAPNAQFGQELMVKTYDSATNTWLDVPTSTNPQTGMITAQVSHLCCFALFAKSTETEKAPTPEPTIIVASKSSISTDVGMYSWIISSVVQNPVIIVIVLAALALVSYFGWWKRRL